MTSIIKRRQLPAVPESSLPAFLPPQQVVFCQHPPVPAKKGARLRLQWVKGQQLESGLHPACLRSKVLPAGLSCPQQVPRLQVGEDIPGKEKSVWCMMKITELWPYSASSFGRREMKSLWNWGQQALCMGPSGKL